MLTNVSGRDLLMRLLNQRTSDPRVISAAIVVICFLSCIFMVNCGKGQKRKSAGHRIIPSVSIVVVHSEKIMLTTELPGRASVFRIAKIRPQVSGLILKRCFREGSDVKAGQLLYEIDPSSFKAVLEKAEANLDVAEKSAKQARAAFKAGMADVVRQKAALDFAVANRKRFEDAFKSRAVSASRRDEAVRNADIAFAALNAAKAQLDREKEAIAVADASIKLARAAVKTARINLGYCYIKAPISGRVGISSVTEGAIVTAYQTVALTIVQQLNPIYINIPQSTTDLLTLRRSIKNGKISRHGVKKNNVKLILEDGSPYKQKGCLEFTDTTVDPSTGSVILRAVFPNPNDILLPGMFVRAVVQEGVNNRAILVPQQAVSRDRKGNPMVMIVNDQSKVEIRMITIDRAIGNRWLVTSGLAPGDRVIIEGVQKVRPGSKVKAVPLKIKNGGN